MKTNVAIELTEEQRDRLANEIDGKVTKRLATRADINAVCAGMIDQLTAEPGPDVLAKVAPAPRPKWEDHPNFTKFAKEIEAGIKRHGYTPPEQIKSYKRGWAGKPFKQ